MSWNGKTEIFFIDPQKTKVNQKSYSDFLKMSLLPECRCLYRQWFCLQARTACKRCFMTCSAILFVSRQIHKFSRWEFLDVFEDVCSLHTCSSFWLLCCITRANVWDVFCTTRYNYDILLQEEGHLACETCCKGCILQTKPNV